MVRPAAKLKTRRSTLGATREERISSTMDSLAATSIYNYSRDSQESRKGRKLTPLRGRLRSLSSERRDEHVPSSIKIEEDGYARTPKLDRSTTSCSITTRSSAENQQSPSNLTRNNSGTGSQVASKGLSPVNVRRTASNPYIRRSSSGQSSRNPSPVPMRRSSSSQGQQSRNSSPMAVRRTASNSTSVNSRQNASPLRRNSPGRSTRDRSPSILRRSSGSQGQPSRDRSPAMRRQQQQQQRARSRSRGRFRQSGGDSVSSRRSVSSAVLASSYGDACNNNYEEKIELVSMTNEHNQNFVRILVSKTSYKPRMGDGVEVVAKSEVPRTRSRANDWDPTSSINCGTIDNSITTSNNSHSTRRVASSNNSNSTRRTKGRNRTNNSVIKSMKKQIEDVEEREADGGPDVALKIGETVDMAATAVNACLSPPNVGPFQTESVPDSKNRRRRSSSRNEEVFKQSTPAVLRMPLEMREEPLRRNTNAQKSYPTQSMKRSNSWSKAIREKLAKEMEERKQKKIQKRMDMEAKKQIQRELEIQKELEKQEMRRSNSFGPRSNSFNSANMRKINYVTRSRSDNKIYQKSYEETFRHRYEDEDDEDEETSYSGSRNNILEKLKASFSMDDRRVPVRSVTFASADGDDYHSYDGAAMSYGSMSRDTGTMQTVIHRSQGTSIIGGVCDCVAPNLQDVRDLRMVDSDISESSEDESDDSSESSSYYYRGRRRY